jgi:hypothetical protein
MDNIYYDYLEIIEQFQDNQSDENLTKCINRIEEIYNRMVEENSGRSQYQQTCILELFRDFRVKRYNTGDPPKTVMYVAKNPTPNSNNDLLTLDHEKWINAFYEEPINYQCYLNEVKGANTLFSRFAYCEKRICRILNMSRVELQHWAEHEQNLHPMLVPIGNPNIIQETETTPDQPNEQFGILQAKIDALANLVARLLKERKYFINTNENDNKVIEPDEVPENNVQQPVIPDYFPPMIKIVINDENIQEDNTDNDNDGKNEVVPNDGDHDCSHDNHSATAMTDDGNGFVCIDGDNIENNED